MNILDPIDFIEFDKNKKHQFGKKSAVIWGHHKEENYLFPLLYISKPKSISSDDFNILLDSLQINLIRREYHY